jgi:hypothetical protein
MTTKALAIDKEINHYLHLLNDKQKKTVLNVMKTFAEDQKDWWDELSKEQQKLILQAETDLDAGKGITHEQAMKKYKNGSKNRIRHYLVSTSNQNI